MTENGFLSLRWFRTLEKNFFQIFLVCSLGKHLLGCFFNDSVQIVIKSARVWASALNHGFINIKFAINNWSIDATVSFVHMLWSKMRSWHFVTYLRTYLRTSVIKRIWQNNLNAQMEWSWCKYIFVKFLKDQTFRFLHLGQNYNRVFVTSYNWYIIKDLLQIYWK